jgi:ATP-dependent protease ClpP protease subunit/cytochrome c556
MPYPNEHAARLLDPDTPHLRVRRTHGSGDGYVQGVHVPDTIDIIWYIIVSEEKKEVPVAQALRFPIKHWTEKEARNWLEENKIKYILFEPASNEEEKKDMKNQIENVEVSREEKKQEAKTIQPVQIQIRGVIVGNEYDTDAWREWIDRGVITPESYVRNLIAQVQAHEIELYINSVGGSVFAAYEIINALRDWKLQHQGKIVVTVGAMAMSAAAVIAVSVADVLRVHRNSIFGFHGAYTETVGGEEIHKDQAALLEKINNEIKQTLITKYNLNPDVVAEWFKEGRIGWIDANDAVKFGMVQEIVDADDKEIEITTDTQSMLQQRGLKIAALFEILTHDKQDEEKNASDTETIAEAHETQNSSAISVSSEYAERRYREGIEQGRMQAHAEIEKMLQGLREELKKYKDDAKKFQALYDKTKAELDKVQKDFLKERDELLKAISEANARCERLLAGALNFVPEKPQLKGETPLERWREALKHCGGDYVKACQLFPEVLAELKSHKNEKT